MLNENLHEEQQKSERIIPHEADSTENSEVQPSSESLTYETYTFLKELLLQNDFEMHNDVNQAYKTLPNESLIVRREDPRKILDLLGDSGGYEIDFKGNERYSNCVEWNPRSDKSRNIHNAYAEGFTDLNYVVAVVGFRSEPEDDIVTLPDATQDFYGLDRRGVRSFKGRVDREKIQFISLRLPGHLVPESELTVQELSLLDTYYDNLAEGKRPSPVMIHRSFTAPQQEHFSYKEAA
jgi:hypothetical protein